MHYCLHRLDRLLRHLEVDPERMRVNLWSSRGLVFSQPVLLALVATGRSRDDAYRIVQRAALRSWQEGEDFRRLLEDDPEVTLDAESLDSAFDLERALGNVGVVFDALDAIR